MSCSFAQCASLSQSFADSETVTVSGNYYCPVSLSIHLYDLVHFHVKSSQVPRYNFFGGLT